MEKAAQLILNSLKCPICGGQIDLFDWAQPVSKKGHNFGCVSDPTHYALFFVHWEPPIRIEKETVMLYENDHLYEVVQDHYFSGIKCGFTEISVRKIDPEFRIIDTVKPKMIRFSKILFDFTKTGKEKLLNRIKTILVFQ